MEHTTATHVHGGPSAPAPTPASAAPPPAASTTGGTLTGALASGMSEDNYSGGCLVFNGGVFLGGATGVKGPPSISDPLVSLDDPSICKDDIFFSNIFRLKQQGQEEFYDALESAPSEWTTSPAFIGSIISAPTSTFSWAVL
jgi:hypothetical protein